MRLGDRFIRELTAGFAEIQSQFTLLNWIDRAILAANLPLEETIDSVLTKSSNHFRASRASAFVVVDGRPLPFTPPNERYAPVVPSDALLARISRCAQVETCRTDGSLSHLLLPIQVPTIRSLNIVLVYEGDAEHNPSVKFEDHDFLFFAEMVANQASLLISKKLESDWHAARDSVEDAYFFGITKNRVLSVEQRWFDLTTYFRAFLPGWAPLQIQPDPEIQILTWDGNSETILLRAGSNQGGPSLAKALFIEKSICGLLIENERKGGPIEPHLYVDPTNEMFAKRYRAYLLDEVPRSELVIPMRWAPTGQEKKIIALVNFEHNSPTAFSGAHIEILHKAVDLVAPFAAALISEELQQRGRDVQHMYMLHGILAKMAKTYRHKVNQRVIAATLSLEVLEGLGQRLEGDEKKFFDRLSRSVISFAELSSSFVNDMPNYVRFGRLPVLPLVEGALGEFDPTEMKRAEDIDMPLQIASTVDPARDLFVFGSHLIREHIYNIINNCVFAVRKQLTAHVIKEGIISVTVLLEKQTDRLDEPDSFPLVIIQIEDNGGGLSDEAAMRYGEFGNTHDKPGGSGYGVAAAREYLVTIGGKFLWKCYDAPGGARGLRQKLCFPQYVEAIHGPMSAQGHFLSNVTAGG
jgi:hypothetical protein